MSTISTVDVSFSHDLARFSPLPLEAPAKPGPGSCNQKPEIDILKLWKEYSNPHLATSKHPSTVLKRKTCTDDRAG
eukprot:3717629-Rhodomonas_salina.3